jgi:hypothetical protein
MARDDRKHTAFVTVDGLYFYIVMPYGLLNALPTFARAMNITLGDLVRDIVTVRVFVMLGIYFVSVKYMFVSIKFMCVFVKLLKI